MYFLRSVLAPKRFHDDLGCSLKKRQNYDHRDDVDQALLDIG